jgi:hypothetical protein
MVDMHRLSFRKLSSSVPEINEPKNYNSKDTENYQHLLVNLCIEETSSTTNSVTYLKMELPEHQNITVVEVPSALLHNGEDCKFDINVVAVEELGGDVDDRDSGEEAIDYLAKLTGQGEFTCDKCFELFPSQT